MEMQTKTLLNIEDMQVSEDVMDVLDEMSADEKKDILIFMQGVRFGKGLDCGNRREGLGGC